MIKSMTGFASLTRESELATLTVTVKTVNHRYLDLQMRLPGLFGDVEADLRDLVQRHVTRGRVELTVTVRIRRPPAVEIDVDEALMAALAEAAEHARTRGFVQSGLAAGDLLRFPNVVTVREQPTDEETWQAVCQQLRELVRDALTELDAMRRREGSFLDQDVRDRATALHSMLDEIVSEAATGDATLHERLTTRLAALRGQVDADATAVAQEIVRWVARSDIHEEVARLRGHLAHLAELVDAPTACGRRLDFLVQEMNREVNTIGSKAEGRRTAELVVAAKAELEKLREQTQNVE